MMKKKCLVYVSPVDKAKLLFDDENKMCWSLTLFIFSSAK